MTGGAAAAPARRPPAAGGDAGGSRRRWAILAVLLAAEVMDVLDTTAVLVAGPDLQGSIGADRVQLQWILAGYALALGSGLVLGGRLGDRFGRRRVFLLGTASFTAASLLCAISGDPAQLIALRLVQGLAGALVLPQSYGVVRAVFPRASWTAAFAVVGPTMCTAAVLGPVVGGALMAADPFGLGWRVVFLVNLPIGLAVVLLGIRLVPVDRGDPAARIPLPPAVLLLASSALVVGPIVTAERGSSPLAAVAVLLGAGGLLLFARTQRTAQRRGTPQLVRATVLRRDFVIGLIGTAAFFACQGGTQLAVSFVTQRAFGQSAGTAGLMGLPFAIGTLIGAALGGAVLAARLGRRALQLGAIVQIAATVALLAMSLAPVGLLVLVVPLAVAGAGNGVVLASLFDLVLASFTDEETGAASGLLASSQSIGLAAGVGGFGSLVALGGGTPLALAGMAALLLGFLLLTPLLPRPARA